MNLRVNYLIYNRITNHVFQSKRTAMKSVSNKEERECSKTAQIPTLYHITNHAFSTQQNAIKAVSTKRL
jgi:hypothetical protein